MKKHGNVKNQKAEKERASTVNKKGKKPTKSELKKQFLATKLKTAYGGVSSVGMNSQGEEMIIRMLAMLDSKDRTALGNGVQEESFHDLQMSHACSSSESEDSVASDEFDDNSDEDDYVVSAAKRDEVDFVDAFEDFADSDDDSGEGSGSSDESSTSDIETKNDTHSNGETNRKSVLELTPAANLTSTETDKKLSRSQFIRQLIRDDRRESRQTALLREEQRQGKVSSVSAADTVNKLNAGRGASEKYIGDNRPPSNKAPSTTVRLNVQADKSGSGFGKLLVVARVMSLPDLLQLARSKFQLSATKADGLLIVESGQVLCDLDLLSLEDGTHLRLCLLRSVVPTSSEEVVSRPIRVKKEQHNAKVPPVVQSISPTYWTPPSSSSMNSHHDQTNMATIVPDTALSMKLKEQLGALYASDAYSKLKAHREALPIHAARDDLLYQINSNQVVVVSGETGSGKTTQLPLYIYEDMCLDKNRAAECYIIVTQPRRIAAITVAERVAFECNTRLGGGLSDRTNVGDLVGYQIRLDSRCSKNTRILYCTTGVLLRKLQSPGFLSRVSHILLDEVHERQVETDFLMTLLKQKLSSEPRLRLVLMSATMQEGLFTAYFDACPLICVSGRTFPVSEHHLDEVHKLVATGQRMSAAERGKCGAGVGGAIMNGDAYAISSGKKDKFAEKNKGKVCTLDIDLLILTIVISRRETNEPVVNPATPF
jgi:flagellar biosynthesis GTPase FlhF